MYARKKVEADLVRIGLYFFVYIGVILGNIYLITSVKNFAQGYVLLQ